MKSTWSHLLSDHNNVVRYIVNSLQQYMKLPAAAAAAARVLMCLA